MTRVINALEKHAPSSVEIVNNIDDADLVIVNIIGRLERMTDLIERLKEQGKKYAIVQYAVRSTKTPDIKSWIPLWRGAEAVWSYYDLKLLCEQDGEVCDFNFYHSPLGTYFRHEFGERKYVIASSGLSYLTESVKECNVAAMRVGKKIFHVGPEIGKGIECSNGISDSDLAIKYSQCEFVSGLRRIEGFEYPVIEGFMCGARPIVFEKPHYRSWFHDIAIFIEEAPREDVFKSLIRIFEKGAEPVTEEEKIKVQDRFDWARIISGFYGNI